MLCFSYLRDAAFTDKVQQIRDAISLGSGHPSHQANRKLAESQDKLTAAKSLIEKLQAIEDVDLSELHIPRRVAQDVTGTGGYGGYGGQNPDNNPPTIQTSPAPSPSPSSSPSPKPEDPYVGPTKVSPIPVKFTLQGVDYNTLSSNTAALQSFKDNFRASFARSLGLPSAAYVKIVSITAGSIVVNTEVLPPTTMSNTDLLALGTKLTTAIGSGSSGTLLEPSFKDAYGISGVAATSTLDVTTLPGYAPHGSGASMASLSWVAMLAAAAAMLLL